MLPVWKLCLLISILSCLACSPCRDHPQDDLLWLQPVEFSQETKAWLEGLEWPKSAYEDFGRLAQHNKMIRQIKHTPKASP